MTPRGRRRLDLAASLSRWVGVAGAILAILKGYSDLRANQAVLATSVTGLVADQSVQAQRKQQDDKRLVRLEQRVRFLEGRRGVGHAATPDTLTQGGHITLPGLFVGAARTVGRFFGIGG